jgi:hypothetical protein
MTEIDWAAELKKIEREYDGLPPEPTPAAARARREAEWRVQEERHSSALAVGAAGRIGLVLALAAAINFWPYACDCGVPLFAYMGAEAVVVAGGVWLAAWTWYHRMPRVHAFSLVVVLWGVALLSMQTLPRVGYAKVDPTNPPRWACASGDQSPSLLSQLGLE